MSSGYLLNIVHVGFPCQNSVAVTLSYKSTYVVADVVHLTTASWHDAGAR